MLVLIDESGCTGFKLDRGSSPVFVVAMAVFSDFTAAERASAAIGALRARLGVKPEFKFSKTADFARDAFFELAATLDFRVRAIIVDKSRIHSKQLREDDDSFYGYFVRMLLEHDNGVLEKAHVKIDGNGDREFRKALSAYLRRQLAAGKIAKVRFADSRADNLVQLADMCAGAIARSYRTDRPDAARWRRLLRPRIADVWEFGK